MILPTPAIYSITNTVSNKKYIGGASYVSQRFYEHKRALRLGIHTNKELQKDWNKYGEQAFTFEILEDVEKSKLSEREDYHMKKEKNRYNVRSGYVGREGGNTIRGWAWRTFQERLDSAEAVRVKLGINQTEMLERALDEFIERNG